MKYFFGFVIIVFICFLSACGGGGGNSSGDGNSSGEDTTIALKKWGTAELLENNDGDVRNPQLASNNQGTVIAAWKQHDGISYNLWVNLYNGSTWEGAQLIESEIQASPQLACDNDGNAIILFRRDGNVWATFFDGTAWGNAELIETNNDGIADFGTQSISFDDNGNAIATWIQIGTEYGVWANRFDGTSWGTPVLLSTNGNDSKTSVVVAVDGWSGSAMVAWEQTFNDQNMSRRLVSAMFDGQYWEAPAYVTTQDAVVTNSPSAPYITFDGLGHTAIIWINTDGGNNNFIWSSRHNGTSWEPVHAHSTGFESEYNYFSRSPKISFDSTGKGSAIWAGVDTGFIDESYIWGSEYNGTSWSDPELIVQWHDSNWPEPDLSMDEMGNTYLTWLYDTGVGWDVYARWFDGVTLSDAERYETNEQITASEMKTVFDGASRNVVIWVQGDGARTNLWVNTFD